MNNKQKLKRTITKVEEVREKYEDSVTQQMRATENASEKLEINDRRLAIRGLDFQETKPIIAFCSTTYGIYVPMKCNRRMRVRAVPLCFCVTLYEFEVQVALPKEKIQIPYDLRAFWKMEQVIKFMEDFVKFQNKLQQVLLWEHRRLKHEKKAKEAEYFKILEEILAMGTLNSGWKKEITYHDLQFVINTKNVKLDVVPLCKMLTRYYANVVMKINQYLKTNASKSEKQKLENIKAEFMKFMEQYFVNIP